MRDFDKKIRDKSVSGDYRILEKDYAPKEDPQVLANKEKEAFDKSKLHLKVKELIRLIYDMKMINKAMMEYITYLNVCQNRL